jgi:uncharacterized protein (DUF433 family)
VALSLLPSSIKPTTWACYTARTRHKVEDKMSVISSDPNILSGEPVFRGTRVPFKSLTDYLEHGKTVSEFLEDFPSVSRAQAIAAIEEARASLSSALK